MKSSFSVVLISFLFGINTLFPKISGFTFPKHCFESFLSKGILSQRAKKGSNNYGRPHYDSSRSIAVFGVGEAGIAGGSSQGGMFSSDPNVLSLLDGEQEKVTANRADLEETILMESSSSRTELLMPTEKERLDSIRWIKKCLKAEARSKTIGKSGGSKAGFGAAKSNTNKNKKKNKKVVISNTAVSTDKVVIGNHEKKDHDVFNPSDDPDGYGAVLQKDGVVRINQVLSNDTAEKLAKYIDEQKVIYEQEIADGLVPELSRFTRVLLKNNRWDVLLPLFDPETKDDDDSIIQQALYEVLLENDSVANVIKSTLGSDAELYEFACLISDPGSDRQVFHPDIAFQGEKQIRTGPLLTCFIALQDVDEKMGPTEFLPQTNTQHYHDLLNDVSKRDDMLSTVTSKLSLLQAGDCTIHDATTLHAGSANRSEKNQRRRLFYFTFRSLSMEDPRTWNNPGSIRPELKDKHYNLQYTQQQLQSWHSSVS